MKKFLTTSLIIFFVFLLVDTTKTQETDSEAVIVDRIKSKKSTSLRKSGSAKQFQYTDLTFLNFQNEAYLNSTDIANFGKNTWLCGKDNKIYKYDGLETASSGTKPTSCSAIETNRRGELFVVDNNRKLFYFKQISNSSYAWIDLKRPNVVDITTGVNGELFMIDTSGSIWEINSVEDVKKFNNATFGNNCRIAYVIEKEDVIYLTNSNNDLFRVTRQTYKVILKGTLRVYDLCTDETSNLYLSTPNGIYRKESFSSEYARLDEFVARKLSCNSKAWAISEDNYVYSSNLPKSFIRSVQ